jgi:cytochrome c oxidase subunit 2
MNGAALILGWVPFAPERASTTAGDVDALFLFELGVSLFFIVVILLFIAFFVIRYRRQSDDEIPPKQPSHYGLEIAWTLVPFLFMLVFFFWGADLYVKLKKPVDGNAMVIHVIAKQWMWKIEHASGAREINELHVPRGQTVKLILASQDVIHDFFVPAFRMKQDVVPGSYVTEWFNATRDGEFHFFCAQYCGMNHSKMVGKVVVMEPADFQAWLAGAVPAESPAAAGSKLFAVLGCNVCHGQRAPTMAGLFASQVPLQDGSTVVADEDYLRRSITDPASQIVAGYPPIMPSYQNLTEDQLEELIAYIKSLSTVYDVTPATGPSTAPAPLVGPSTRPAPGDQPGTVPDFPPAENTVPVVPPRAATGQPGAQP